MSTSNPPNKPIDKNEPADKHDDQTRKSGAEIDDKSKTFGRGERCIDPPDNVGGGIYADLGGDEDTPMW